MYTFCTDCWLIAVLYFTWLAFDWNTPKKGKSMGLLAPLPRPRNLPLAQAEGSSLRVLPFFLLNTCYVKHIGLDQGVVGVGGLEALLAAPSWSS